MNINISDSNKNSFAKICDKAGDNYAKRRYKNNFSYNTDKSKVARHITNYIDSEDSQELVKLIFLLFPYTFSLAMFGISIIIWFGYLCFFCGCKCCVPENTCTKKNSFYVSIFFFGVVILTGILAVSYNMYIKYNVLKEIL